MPLMLVVAIAPSLGCRYAPLLSPPSNAFQSADLRCNKPPLRTQAELAAVGWDRGADRASNDADVSSIPPIIRLACGVRMAEAAQARDHRAGDDGRRQLAFAGQERGARFVACSL
jgi:hypothetical protein